MAKPAYYSLCQTGSSGPDVALIQTWLNGIRSTLILAVVATLIGGKDSKTRFAEVSGMFNYAFANYSRAKIAAAGEQMGTLAVRGGRVNEIPYGAEADMSMLLKTGEEISAPEITLPDKIKAPVTRGDVIGTAKYTSPAGESITVNLIALESAEPATFWDYIKKIVG